MRFSDRFRFVFGGLVVVVHQVGAGGCAGMAAKQALALVHEPSLRSVQTP